tara:strand:+ start:1039 stop:1563 length:525 start_codon:yes stop_codon:yes gene_type:complete
MRPIPSIASNEALTQFERAQRLLKRVKVLEKSEAGTQPGYNVTFSTEPQNIMFAAESGGQTRNAYYSTNQHLLDSDNVTNKGATSEAFNLESLGGKLNPHESGGSDRQVIDGILSKARESILIQKAYCNVCGGNQYTGHRFDGCPGEFEEDEDDPEMIPEDRPHDPSDPGRTIY